MKIINLKDLACEDFSLEELIAIDKIVENNQTFPVFDDKRKTSVLVHLRDCNIKYVLADGTKMYVKKGSVVYIPHTAKYRVTYLAGSGEYALAQLVAFEMKDSEGKPFVLADNIVKLCDEHGNIYADRFDRLVEISRGKQFDFCNFRGALYTLFSDISKKLLRSPADNPKQTYALIPCTEYLKNNECTDISVSELARMCHISESCFRRLFAMQYGLSPKEYIIRARLAKAKNLLQSSNMTVGEISDLTGFGDVAYFSKIFKSRFGISPSAYRTGFML